ncbi:helix-turn-helix domain-containing protein [Polymorphum gilvum]|nr:XRE family transcriptional regulator [Polymorphum gilvum]
MKDPLPEPSPLDPAQLDRQIADRLKALRLQRGWSLDDLARLSGVSRASLSRLENAEVSASAATLGRLCAAHGMPLSRLMYLVEEGFAPLIRYSDQPLWRDPETGFRRRAVSPPAQALAGEVLEGSLPPATRISYERPPRPGLEHHLVLLDGALAVSLDGTRHTLSAGDCLRYQLFGSSLFETPEDAGARYLLFLV